MESKDKAQEEIAEFCALEDVWGSYTTYFSEFERLTYSSPMHYMAHIYAFHLPAIFRRPRSK